MIELPTNDADFATRWRLIKSDFSKAIPPVEHRSNIRLKRGERGIWQGRYRSHLICDEADYQAHVDYVHINSIKHGLLNRVKDWPYSSFHRLVEKNLYPIDWAGSKEKNLDYDD